MISVIDFEATQADAEFRITSWLAENQYEYYRSSGYLGIPKKMEHMITHVVITGGPRKSESGDHLAEYIRNTKIPVLGICLGCMCIVRSFGGSLVACDQPNRLIDVTGSGMLGVVGPLKATAAHKEKIVEVGDQLSSVFWTGGEVVGVVHREKPIYGVMFHPESPKTSCGEKLLSTFFSFQQH